MAWYEDKDRWHGTTRSAHLYGTQAPVEYIERLSQFEFDPAWRVVAWADGLEFLHLLGGGAREYVIVCESALVAAFARLCVELLLLSGSAHEFVQTLTGFEVLPGGRFRHRISDVCWDPLASDAPDWPMGLDEECRFAWGVFYGAAAPHPDNSLYLCVNHGDGDLIVVTPEMRSHDTHRLCLGEGVLQLSDQKEFAKYQARVARAHVEYIVRSEVARSELSELTDVAQELVPIFLPSQWTRARCGEMMMMYGKADTRVPARFIAPKLDYVMLPYDHHLDCVVKVRPLVEGRRVKEVVTWAGFNFGQSELACERHELVEPEDMFRPEAAVERHDDDVLLIHLSWKHGLLSEADGASMLATAGVRFDRIVIVDTLDRGLSGWMDMVHMANLDRLYSISHVDVSGGSDAASRNVIICLDRRAQLTPREIVRPVISTGPRLCIWIAQPDNINAGTLAIYRMVIDELRRRGRRAELLWQKTPVGAGSNDIICVHGAGVDAWSRVRTSLGCRGPSRAYAEPLRPNVFSGQAIRVDYVVGRVIGVTCASDTASRFMRFTGEVDVALAHVFTATITFDADGSVSQMRQPIEFGVHFPRDMSAVSAMADALDDYLDTVCNSVVSDL